MTTPNIKRAALANDPNLTPRDEQANPVLMRKTREPRATSAKSSWFHVARRTQKAEATPCGYQSTRLALHEMSIDPLHRQRELSARTYTP
jgi:hypothetical protein